MHQQDQNSARLRSERQLLQMVLHNKLQQDAASGAGGGGGGADVGRPGLRTHSPSVAADDVHGGSGYGGMDALGGPQAMHTFAGANHFRRAAEEALAAHMEDRWVKGNQGARSSGARGAWRPIGPAPTPRPHQLTPPPTPAAQETHARQGALGHDWGPPWHGTPPAGAAAMGAGRHAA
jgi:hypothetical protein